MPFKPIVAELPALQADLPCRLVENFRGSLPEYSVSPLLRKRVVNRSRKSIIAA